MTTNQYFAMIVTVLLLAGGLAVGAELLRRSESKRTFMQGKSKYFMWTLGLVLGAVAFIAYLWHEPAIYHLQGLNVNSPFGPRALALSGFAVILYWLTHAAVLINVMSVFFEYRTLKHMAKFFSPIVVILQLVFLPTFFTSVFGKDFVIANTTPVLAEGVKSYLFGNAYAATRATLLLLQAALVLAISVYHLLRDKIDPPRGKEWLTLLYTLPLAVLCTMPAFAPQALIGLRVIPNSIHIYDLEQAHRFVLYGAIIIPYLIYLGLRRKDEETKRMVMIFITLGLLWVYLGRWDLFSDATLGGTLLQLRNWPLHLCNTAMFLVPLALIFRWQKLFNFCLFINVMGALLAMVMAETLGTDLNAIGTERVSYWINHYAAFFMPVLLVALKIFKRPKFRDWVSAVVVFAVYYLAVLIINPLLDTNFFFLNSQDTPVMDALLKFSNQAEVLVESGGPFAKTVTLFGRQVEFFPLYQTLFFVVYVGVFTVGVRFVYEILFRSWDKAEERRERERSYKMMKKELNDFLGGKPITEPVTGDSTPRLAIKHFSKKYGANKHYSVHDASFEVNSGEVFGFLGPNGAGKSTIIKSIVGMQTITEGNIEVCGFDVDRQPVQAKMQIGFVPDHYALYENLTGREYINYIADLYRVDIEYRDAFIEKYLERFQLRHSFDNQMKTYSHGMKQKITIMAALVHNPKIWILDEPLTGLDPTSVHEVKECMKEHAAAGNIVFFSSHIIDVVEKICDRIAIIKGGKIQACTSMADLEANGKQLERFYLDIIYADDGELTATDSAKGEPNV